MKRDHNKHKRKGVAHKEGPQARKRLKLVLAILLPILAAAGAVPFIPFTTTYQTSEVLNYRTERRDDHEMELGETRVDREGRRGELNETVEVKGSLFSRFVLDRVSERIIESDRREPQNRVVLHGTLRYQYMHCSDGTYRYYEDDDFQNPNTGFTHSREDYCRTNGNGEMLRLAHGPPGATAAPTQPRPNTPANCTQTTIPPSIEYIEDDFLPEGETQPTTEGASGVRVSCPDGDDYTIPPLTATHSIGTGRFYGRESTPSTPPSEPTRPQRDPQARAQCQANYNSAMAQLRASGAAGSDAARQIQQAHHNCLRAAGY